MSFSCSTSPPAFGVVSVYFSHYKRCVISICTSLLTSHVEHLLMCLLTNSVCFLVRCLFRYFTHILIRLFIFFLLNFKNSLYMLDTSSLSYMCFVNIFLPVCSLSYYIHGSVFHRADNFNFN